MSQAAITLIVLVVAIILFVIDILPMGLVAFCVPVVLYFLGIIEVGDIFTDVINSNVILIIAMCVIGAAFFKTGLAYKVSQKVMKLTHSEKGLILVVILLSGVMSGFVSNSGTVAVLLPIVMGIARAADIKPVKLLIPLVTGATLGADFTVIGSPGNLIAKNTIETYSNGTMHADSSSMPRSASRCSSLSPSSCSSSGTSSSRIVPPAKWVRRTPITVPSRNGIPSSRLSTSSPLSP